MAQPQSLNSLNTNDFKFTIAKLPNVEFWCNKANIPGFQMFNAEFGTPFGNLPLQGTSVQWEPLVLSFLPDETLRNYLEVFDWAMTIGFPEDFSQFDPKGLVSDATFTLLDSNKAGKVNINFINAWPFTMDGIDFDTTQEDVVYRPVSVSFLYDRWKYVRL